MGNDDSYKTSETYMWQSNPKRYLTPSWKETWTVFLEEELLSYIAYDMEGVDMLAKEDNFRLLVNI